MKNAGSVKIEDYSKEFIKWKDEAVKKAMEEIGLVGERYAKEECPVDSGRLRNSITYATEEKHDSGTAPAESKDYATKGMPEKASVYIGTNVEYAQAVEFNDRARHETGRAHFLRDSVTSHIDQYKEILKKELKG